MVNSPDSMPAFLSPLRVTIRAFQGFADYIREGQEERRTTKRTEKFVDKVFDQYLRQEVSWEDMIHQAQTGCEDPALRLDPYIGYHQLLYRSFRRATIGK